MVCWICCCCCCCCCCLYLFLLFEWSETGLLDLKQSVINQIKCQTPPVPCAHGPCDIAVAGQDPELPEIIISLWREIVILCQASLPVLLWTRATLNCGFLNDSFSQALPRASTSLSVTEGDLAQNARYLFVWGAFAVLLWTGATLRRLNDSAEHCWISVSGAFALRSSISTSLWRRTI